jgi:hypothetical protein
MPWWNRGGRHTQEKGATRTFNSDKEWMTFDWAG